MTIQCYICMYVHKGTEHRTVCLDRLLECCKGDKLFIRIT